MNAITNLEAESLKALEKRNNLDPAIVDDVIMGCVMQVGEQAVNIGRTTQNRVSGPR